MATAPGFLTRKGPASVRPGLSHLKPDPQSPKTPQRVMSSAFSSPSASYRSEDDSVVFELGARHLSAGFSGDSAPRCRLGFGPEESRRVGDYRKWLPGYEERHRKKRKGYEWGEDHELWRMDVRELDLGLVEDKIERAVREAYSKYLLLDSKSRRMILLIPPVMPHPLLSRILTTLFLNFQIPSITFLPTPLACTIAAGCRSSLVVDIGWEETTTTGIYEYREVHHSRSTKAMSAVTLDMAKLLHFHRNGRKEGSYPREGETTDPLVNDLFEYSEEITTRMAWCQSLDETTKSTQAQELPVLVDGLKILEDDKPEPSTTSEEDDPLMAVPAPFKPDSTLQIPFSHFAKPAETTLFAKTTSECQIDDHELPLHILTYKALLALPPDVRSVCMSRIIITGGGSRILGLKGRLLEEVAKLVRDDGWDPVHGKAADERRRRLQERSSNQLNTNPTSDSTPSSALPDETPKPSPAFLAPQVPDPIEEKLRQDQAKDAKPYVSGVIRGIETLGAWAGGSLVATLKIKGIVEIEKDTFLQHGLAGAKRDAETSVVPQRQSYGPGASRTGGGIRTSWTLGTWA